MGIPFRYGLLVACWMLLMPQERECAFSKRRNPQQQLLQDMFENYDSDSLSYNAEASGVQNSTGGITVKFTAKLVRIIGVNERANTMQTEWWVQQHWSNKDLSWNASKYNGVEAVYVSPGRIWTPDILLYNRQSEDKKKTSKTLYYSR
ncbi:neuronal acetylcholine receptor subunit alpha-7 isoform X2 [Exaiptasia diaphana]|nr:neuronal acetylcholine receptor subunit alpha-7 isoform X2 [Exaiptasia diaphana]XP_020910053.1 neuronal acetylcholine receptor subunit alpha-7 isoform X2 [Exaiptasia diaphana]XP_020910054.1 neuronal acetylcholine receptor subunit alpha-7 isoform X2 [Exaiptasia diaphana]